jgi:hypothetical protein
MPTFTADGYAAEVTVTSLHTTNAPGLHYYSRHATYDLALFDTSTTPPTPRGTANGLTVETWYSEQAGGGEGPSALEVALTTGNGYAADLDTLEPALAQILEQIGEVIVDAADDLAARVNNTAEQIAATILEDINNPAPAVAI